MLNNTVVKNLIQNHNILNKLQAAEYVFFDLGMKRALLFELQAESTVVTNMIKTARPDYGTALSNPII